MPPERYVRYSTRIKKNGSLYKDRTRSQDVSSEVDPLDVQNQPGTSQDAHLELTCEVFDAEIHEEVDASSSSYSSDDSDLWDEETDISFQDAIKHFIVDSQLPLRQTNKLLKVLRRYMPDKFPKDANHFLEKRTMLTIASGQVWYQGIKSCFANELANVGAPAEDTVHVDMSVNVAIPIHNSSTTQFWPILMNLFELPGTPVMTVGFFSGKSLSGNVEKYLRPMVREFNEIQNTGISMGGKRVQLRLRALFDDSPAREFVKGVARFNDKPGCLKCNCTGAYYSATRKVIFPATAGLPRTDLAFKTPLVDIHGVNIVEHVIVADRLHLLELGVTKTLLEGWYSGFGSDHSWTTEETEMLSVKLVAIQLPSEINTKMQPFANLSSWKETQLQSFLHYAAVGILEDILNKEAFDHFMCYFCAITLFSSNAYREHWKYAGILLEQFVFGFDIVYGHGHISSNVHQLLHVYDDIAKFGSLDMISSSRFENYMQRLKRMLQSEYTSIEEVLNRAAELEALESRSLGLRANFPRIKKLEDETAVLYVRKDFLLREGMRDGWFLAIDNSIIQYSGVLDDGRTLKVKGRRLTMKGNMFTKPISAAILYMFVGKITDLSSCKYAIPISHIKCKLVAVERGIQLINFFPLLHTLQEAA